jgi:Tol biopolymer transport system component
VAPFAAVSVAFALAIVVLAVVVLRQPRVRFSPADPPDHRHVALADFAGRPTIAVTVPDLELIDPASGDLAEVTEHSGGALSPDRSTLATVHEVPGGTYKDTVVSISPMTADGPAASGGTDLATEHDGEDSDPVWSPDGTRLAFDHGDPARRTVTVVDVAGHDVRDLTSGAHPAWSVDGSRLYAMTAAGGQIEAIDVAGGSSSILPLPMIVNDPAPGPNRLAFEDMATRSIWVADLDGTHPRRLSDCATMPYCVRDRNPVWSPDGTKLAFLRDAGLGSTHLLVIDSTSGVVVTEHDYFSPLELAAWR